MKKSEFMQRSRELLQEYADSIVKASKTIVLNRFDREKDVDGKNFAPLKASTIRERKSSNPILKRTSKLRNSIQFVSKNGLLKIDSSLEYAQNLNDGKHSGYWGKNSDGSPKKIKPAPPSKVLMKSRKFLDFTKEIRLKSGSVRRRLLETFKQKMNKLRRDFAANPEKG